MHCNRNCVDNWICCRILMIENYEQDIFYGLQVVWKLKAYVVVLTKYVIGAALIYLELLRHHSAVRTGFQEYWKVKNETSYSYLGFKAIFAHCSNFWWYKHFKNRKLKNSKVILSPEFMAVLQEIQMKIKKSNQIKEFYLEWKTWTIKERTKGPDGRIADKE